MFKEGRPILPPKAAEVKYRRALAELVTFMQRETAAQIATAFKAQAAMTQDASFTETLAALVASLQRRFNVLFTERAGGLAEALARGVNTQSAASVGSNLKELSGEVTLSPAIVAGAGREVLEATIKANVGLIKSIPSKYFEQIEGAVMRSIQSGNGLAELQPEIERLGVVTKERAALIARDQTSKATAALNRVRMEAVGIRKFKWLHSGGGKEPRRLHKEGLNGNIYSMDDPPVIDDRTGERGFPGQLINCRCRMVPVLEFKST